ncbi:hypothetical protein C8R44DRAFT_989865 [Mycena epipterygia]|nr:hypothetical protein C8R44DRAFT_989865 [Mycena epipterygia]
MPADNNDVNDPHTTCGKAPLQKRYKDVATKTGKLGSKLSAFILRLKIMRVDHVTEAADLARELKGADSPQLRPLVIADTQVEKQEKAIEGKQQDRREIEWSMDQQPSVQSLSCREQILRHFRSSLLAHY